MPQYLSDNHMLYVYEADATSLMDPLVHKHQYRLSLNNANVCSSDVFLLFVVNSAREHREEREVIRETWGSIKEYGGAQIRTVFLVGELSTGQSNERLKVESDVHGDLIQGNFIDDYANMTYKTVMGLYWVNTYCPGASFVMKADDDVSINLYKLIYFLKEISQTQSKLSSFFYGSCGQHFAQRSRSSKWYISFSDYEYNLYPPYCMGLGYVFSKEVAFQIYSATTKVPFLWLEDVYIGFCAKLAHVVPMNNYFGYYFLQPMHDHFGYYFGLPWSFADAPWEYTILKMNNDGKTERRDTWAYINSLKGSHSLRYYRYVGTFTCVIVLLACSLICMLVMVIQFRKRISPFVAF